MNVSNECPPSFHTAVHNDRVVAATGYHELAIVSKVNTVYTVCVLAKHFGYTKGTKYFVGEFHVLKDRHLSAPQLQLQGVELNGSFSSNLDDV